MRSAVAQALGRQLLRRSSRRDDACQEADHDGREDDEGEVLRQELHGNVVEVVHVLWENFQAGEQLDPALQGVDPEPEGNSEERSERQAAQAPR